MFWVCVTRWRFCPYIDHFSTYFSVLDTHSESISVQLKCKSQMPTSAMSTEYKYHVLPFQHGGKSFQLWWSPHYIFGQDYQEAKSHLTEVYCWLSVMDTLVWFGPIGTHRNSVDQYFTLQRQSQRRNTTEKTPPRSFWTLLKHTVRTESEIAHFQFLLLTLFSVQV